MRILRYGVLLAVVLLATLLLVSTVIRPRPHPNVVLVSIDTLRADHLGAYGYTGGVSPFIDSIGARGTVFDDVVAPMPATDPSHAAILTGLHPMRTGVLTNSMALPSRFETLGEVFRRAGYATIGATGVYHLSARYGFSQGFEEFSGVDSEDEIRRSADTVNASV